jgi:hypothetical protein
MKKHWGFAILLSLPIFFFYASHYSNALVDEPLIATGFIQTDQVSYMANAKEYGERGGFNLQYSLPFSTDYNNEAIYFQPQLFVLGQIMRILPIDPGLLLMLFGFTFTILCIRMCIVIFSEVIHDKPGPFRNIGLLLFIWGGGLICFSSGVLALFTKNGFEAGLKTLFALEPGAGWWFLNLGRNFVYPMEAYYHFLFFGMVYFVFKKQYRFFLLLLILLVFSHPFTGTAALLISTVWVLLEKYYIRRLTLPTFVLPGLAVLAVTHFSFYFLYLPSNAAHRILMKQWALDWSMTAERFIPAYAIVGLLVLLRVSTPKKLLSVFSNPFNRFLAVWAIVNFLLENHEFAIPAHQPLHFTRGYTWSALFLLGYPVVRECSEAFFQRFSPAVARVLLGFCSLLFLSDNITWFSHFGRLQSTEIGGIKITPEQKETLDFLATLEVDDRLLVCRDYHISYLATVYTGFRPIFAHRFNTVDWRGKIKMQDDFVQRCVVGDGLRGERVVVVYDFKNETNCMAEGLEELYRNGRYGVYDVFLYKPIDMQ